NPLRFGIITSSRTRSGGAAAILRSATSASSTVSARMPCCVSSRARNPAMSGSSSTTRTWKAPGAERPAGSLIHDLDAREVVGVLRDARLDRRPVRALGAVLDQLAERRDLVEAVGHADPFHAVAELAQLLHVAAGEGSAQRVELLGAVLHEGRDK